MIDKYHVTELELRHFDTFSNHSTEGNTPSPDLLVKYVSRFQESHSNYHSIDVDSIKWLIGGLSSSHLLSLGNDSCPSAMSFSNIILRYLRTLGNFIKIGKTKYANNELKGTLLFTKMEWMQQFKYPTDIIYFWFEISSILREAQSSIPMEEYSKHSKWYDEWFKVVHSSWQFMFDEVQNHLFFRKFWKTEHIPKFQHSVHWTIFFYRFQTDKDFKFPHILKLKNKILFDNKFRNGIRAFIDAVETALDEVNLVTFSPTIIPKNGIILDPDLNTQMNTILRSISASNKYEQWVTAMFVQCANFWISALEAVADGSSEPFPKEIVAAKMLWGVEAIVAYIEPIVFRRNGEDHPTLLSFRNRIRMYIHQLILKEEWI